MSKKDIASYNYEELTEEMNRIGTKSFRGETDLFLAPSETGGFF